MRNVESIIAIRNVISPKRRTEATISSPNRAEYCVCTWAKYLLNPKTGKQHQLRVHLNSLDIAIKNDPFYPILKHKDDADFSQPLQLLAKEISFTDPLLFTQMQFKSQFELTL